MAEDTVAPEYLGHHHLRDVHVRDQQGRTCVHTFRRYDCSDRGVRRYLAKMETIFRAEGLLRETTTGTCPVLLLRARDNVRAVSAVLRANPGHILSP